jgi:hypothetical protein
MFAPITASSEYDERLDSPSPKGKYMTKPKDDDEGFGEIHCYASVYDEIVAKRKAMGVPMAVGKHTAANSKYCKETIEALQATGHHSAADWAIWMLWWRMMDWTTAKQVDEMRVEEIASLRKRIDQLEREKRGIGPEDQYQYA